MSSSPPIQGGCEVYPNGQESEDVVRNGSVNNSMNSKLRAELKRHYYLKKEAVFGENIKHYWKSESWMFKVLNLTPEVRHHQNLKQLCNKPTMLYWDISAQNADTNSCPGIVFACVYKCWFRCHDNKPDIGFGKFFAHPFQMTSTGPQTIPEILKAHAHLCDRAASQLKSTKSGDAESCPIERSRWQHFHLLPLCRAIIVLLDQYLSPPARKMDGIISLDDEVQRQTAVLILTGYNHDLSGAINFDTIRSETLPLARHDVSVTDSANMIRVSLKTAVQFIAELQQREERAFSSSKRDSTDPTFESKTDGVFAAVNNADEYVEDLIDNASENDSKWFTIKYALEVLKAKERGEDLHEAEFDHWNANWV